MAGCPVLGHPAWPGQCRDRGERGRRAPPAAVAGPGTVTRAGWVLPRARSAENSAIAPSTVSTNTTIGRIRSLGSVEPDSRPGDGGVGSAA